jgi:hydroxymethylbilane synthase
MAQTSQAASAMAVNYELVPIISSGDKIAGPLRDHGGKALFTKEIDGALLKGEIDLAIHSMKDVETPLPEGLEIGAVPYREDPRDVLITSSRLQLGRFEKGTTIGTSSLRRARQLTFYHPDISILPCRGNIQTRLQKYVNAEFDGIVLALAGLKRMGIFNNNVIDGIDANVQILDSSAYIPAPGQGALVIIKRSNDHRFDDILKRVDHPDSHLAIQIERAVVDSLNLTCHDPVGVYVQIKGNMFWVDFMLFNNQGPITEHIHGLLENRHELIQSLVKHIKGQ